MAIKVGSLVKVIGLNRNVKGSPGVVEAMLSMLGKTYVVKEITNRVGDVWYKLENERGYSYYFHREWLLLLDATPRGNPRLCTDKYRRELLTDIRRHFSDGYATRSFCNFGVIVKKNNGEYVKRIHNNEACHAGIYHYNTKKNTGEEVVELVDFLSDAKGRIVHFHRRKNLRNYYNWLMKYCNYVINHSFVSHCFQPTNMSSYVRNGVRMNVESTATEILAALNILRMGREKTYTVPMYRMMTLAGYDEGLSIFVGLSFALNQRGNYLLSIDPFHSPICRTVDKTKVLQASAGIFKFPEGVPYREHARDWRVFDALSDRRGDEYWGDFLHRIVVDTVGDREAGWGIRKPNVMKPAQFKQVLDILQEEVNKVKQ